MTAYADFYRRSIDDRDGFWAQEAQRIDWETQPLTCATTRSIANSMTAPNKQH